MHQILIERHESDPRILIFVRRNDILLQCGVTFVMPLPSLGVSSLDLGRSFNRTAPFFTIRRRLFGCGARNSEPRDVRHEPAHHGFEVRTKPIKAS
jgi:hypothetical protein